MNKKRKTIPSGILLIIGCLMLIPAATVFAKDAGITGTWYGNFYDLSGIESTLQLNENNTYSIQYDSESPTYGTWTEKNNTIVLDEGKDNELTLKVDNGSLMFDSDGLKYSFDREKPAEVGNKSTSDNLNTPASINWNGIWKVIDIDSDSCSLPAEYYGIENAYVSISSVPETSDKKKATAEVQLYLKMNSVETPLKTKKIKAKVEDTSAKRELSITADDIVGDNDVTLAGAAVEINKEMSSIMDAAMDVASTYTDDDSVNLRSPSPVLDERSRRSLRCCVDGVSDSPYTSSNLRTDGQPDCSGSDCLQQSSPDSMNVCSSSPDTGGKFPPDDDGKPVRGLPSIDKA